VRSRILLWMVLVTAVGVGVFAVPLAFTLSDLHREEKVVRLERSASEASSEVPTDFPKRPVRFDLVQEEAQVIGLYGRDGRRISGAGPRHADSIVRDALRGEVRDRDIGSRLVVAQPVTRGEKVVGAVRASAPLSVVTDRTRTAFIRMAIAASAAIGIAGLVALWQSRRLARPVARLAETASALGDGDFTVREERSGVPEVDSVSHALGVTAERLDRMLQRERAFSADASHQLRTPLTSLRVTLEAAELDPNGDQAAAIGTALDEVDRLDRTIDDLVALAREIPIDDLHTDLRRVLREFADDWRGRRSEPGRTLEVRVPDDLPEVRISDRALRQILEVLVDNAFRHGAGQITVEARGARPGAVVAVTDAGPGIAGDPDRIFDRRVSNSGRSGIGLALARSLAEAEGGRLVLSESGPPATTFSVYLPGASPPPSEPATFAIG
jgi:signal transduction histidine kinase